MHILYKYTEDGHGSWVVLDLKSYTVLEVESLMEAFFPSGMTLAQIREITAFDKGVVMDPVTLCIPTRFRGESSISHLRKTPEALVQELVECWKACKPRGWRAALGNVEAEFPILG